MSIKTIQEGEEVLARVNPGEMVDGVVKEIHGDRYTIAIFEGTVEMSVEKQNVWRNGYEFKVI